MKQGPQKQANIQLGMQLLKQSKTPSRHCQTSLIIQNVFMSRGMRFMGSQLPGTFPKTGASEEKSSGGPWCPGGGGPFFASLVSRLFCSPAFSAVY